MSDRDALLSAVLAEPDDDAPRLIFADYIDDHDEPERAEFIRLQIELANTPHQPPCKGDVHAAGGFGLRCSCVVSNLRKRADRLLDTHIIIDERGPLQPRCLWAIGVLGKVNKWEFHRGFVSAITCTAADAIAHLDAILAAHPVQEVTLTSELDWDARGNLWLCSADHRTSRECKIGIPDDHPVWGQDFSNEPLRLSPQRNAMVAALLAAEWPRIKKWNLPPQQQYGPSPLRAAFRTWQEAIDAQAYSMRHFSR